VPNVDTDLIRQLLSDALLVLADDAETRVKRAYHAVAVWDSAPQYLRDLAGETAGQELRLELYSAKRMAITLAERPFLHLPIVLEVGCSLDGEPMTRTTLQVGVA
jgi:hypothetical protein